MRKFVALVVFVLGLLGGMLPTAPTVDASVTPMPGMGVQFHATWSDYTDTQRAAFLDKMAAAGVKWVRVDLGWRTFEEYSKGKVEQWYVDLTDRTVTMARARGINVLATLWSTPAWANGGKAGNVPPADVNEYARFINWAAAKWKGRIAAWEIWNEPNLEGFWVGKDPVKYAAMVRAAYPAVKSADPNALVVAGSVSQNDDAWLTAMYDAGAKGYFDVLSTHPYQGPSDAPPEVLDTGKYWLMDHIGAVHKLMVARGDGAKKIWATEFGWSSHPNTGSEPAWKKGVTEAQQADYLVRSLQWFGSNHPYVTNVFWYNDRNKNTGDAQEDNYGLLRRDLSDKPAYTALKNLLGTSTTPTTAPPSTTTTAPPATTTTTAPKTTTTTAPSTTPTTAPSTTTTTAPKTTTTRKRGYKLVASDGKVFSYSSASSGVTNYPVPSGQRVVAGAGNWSVTDRGAVIGSNGTASLGGVDHLPLNSPIVGMAATPSGHGYWLVATDGGIFSFGDAKFFGSTGAIRLNRPIVGMASTPSGNGYWLVASDGGIFSYGDARFFGSTGSLRLNKPIVGMSSDPRGNGYWLVASDGGIFAFNVPFHGSTGSISLNRPIVGMVSTGSGNGYWFAAADGGIFAYGDAEFYGSAADTGATFTAMAPVF